MQRIAIPRKNMKIRMTVTTENISCFMGYKKREIGNHGNECESIKMYMSR